MSKVVVVTDSNAGISQEEAAALGVVVVPMPFTIDGEEYLEGISITQDEFYEKLNANLDVMTSQPSEDYLENLWRDLLAQYDEVLYIPMSSGLSATCENAKGYANNFDGKVYVVDNTRISVTQRESVMEALTMISQDIPTIEIKDRLEETGKDNSIYILLDTLKYLKKGGRISKASAMLGDMFKLKPILTSDGGAFEKYAVTFTLEQAKKKMIQKAKQDLEGRFKEQYEKGQMVISVGYTNCRDKALKFFSEVSAAFPDVPIHYMDPLSLSVSCHIGGGALAIALAYNSCL